MRNTSIFLAAAALLAGCESGGTSTSEIEAAAIERTRQQLNLPANAPLRATVWTGTEYEGQPVLCGTVSSEVDGGASIRPQRFAATGDPIQWLAFGDAHDPMTTAQPNKFVEWEAVCATGPEKT